MSGKETVKPTEIRVRMYQVGFGDCFLVSFYYAHALPDGRDRRNVLIDFGSTRAPKAGAPLDGVAEQISEHCSGQLDAIVLTHRHKDHISGFGLKTASGVIDGLSPRLVVRPWTEDPEAALDATGRTALATRSREFAASLAVGQTFATALGESIAAERGIRGHVKQLALDQIANKAAVDQLDSWANDGAAAYVFFGSDSRLEEFVPGVQFRVLGPPTVEQWPAVTGQRAEDPEYWMIHRRLLRESLAESGLGEATIEGAIASATKSGDIDPGPVRWLVARMQSQQLASLHRVVRTLDDALNNTSVILLIEAGHHRLLFPGDAQIENWSYALKEALSPSDRAELLGNVSLYKVGHHGSRNATPRSLFGLWGEERDADRPITALMSTLSGVHGESEATFVPRSTLVAALDRRTTLYSTNGLAADRKVIEVATSLASGSQFELVS